MRRRRSTMLLLGAVLALLAFFVLYLGLSAGATRQPVLPTATPEPTVEAIVAANDIPSYTLVKATDLTTTQIRESQVTTDTVTNANQVIGQVLIRPYTKG